MDERRHAPRPRCAAGLLLCVTVCLLLSGCAWVEPENRRTWNLFEEHLVPEDEPAFSLALPLTAPGGLLALLVDIVIVHPIAVVDDAAREVGDVFWDDIDWDAEYWTESAIAPFRVVATGVGFVADWFVRAIGPVPPYLDGDSSDERDAEALRRRRLERERALLAALAELPGAPERRLPKLPALPWGSELRETLATLLASDDYRVRFALHRVLLEVAVPGLSDGWTGHRDADPRVRALMLTSTRPDGPLPPDLRQALLDDPDPVVAALALQRLD